MLGKGGPTMERSAVQKTTIGFGVVYALFGVLGFIPGITVSATRFDAVPGEGLLLGVFAVNVVHNLRQELVHGRADDFVPDVGPEFLDFVPFADLCSAGVWGRPQLARAERGARAFEAAVQGTAASIVETFRQLDRAKGR